MKTKSSQSLQGAIFALGIASLMAGVLQLTTNLIQIQFDVHRLPAFLTSDAMYAALLLIPEILMFLYIVLRLYGEMHSAWRVALSAIAYPAVGFIWSLIIAISSGSIIGAILGYGSIFAAIAIPVILSIVGLVKKAAGMTLISFMMANLLYATYTGVMYAVTDGSFYNAVFIAVLFITPVMLFLAADLAVQYRQSAIDA